MPNKSNEGVAHLILLILIVTVSFVALIYLAFQNAKHTEGNKEINTQETSPTPENLKIPEQGDKIYTSKSYGFSLHYPSNYFSKEFENGVSIADEKWQEETVHHPYVAFTVVETDKTTKEYAEQQITTLKNEGYGIIGNDCSMHCVSEHTKELTVGKNIPGQQYSVWGVSGGSSYTLASLDKGLIIKIDNHIAGSRAPGETAIPEDDLRKILSSFEYLEESQEFVQVDCSTMQTGTGITYLGSYFIGDQCNFQTKQECVSADVVSFENGKLKEEWSQDGVHDCLWFAKSDSSNKCRPKYVCGSQ
jgi:hypothetical protein